MNFKRLTKASIPVALCAAVFAAPVHAAIVINNWTLDIGAVLGGGEGQLQGIDTLNFAGVFASVDGDEIPNGVPETGETTATDFLLNTTAKNGGLAMTDTGSILGLNFEITGVGATVQTNGVVAPDGLGGFTVNSVVNTGTLDIYLDSNINALPTPGGGTGMDDGTLIASFTAIGGQGGGTFNTRTLDGSQDVSFVLTFALAGVVLDDMGNDLALGTLLALTDANTDADPDTNGIADTQIANGPLAGMCPLANPLARCGLEDGSFSIATVPEPTTLALAGLALVGLGLGRRRKQR